MDCSAPYTCSLFPSARSKCSSQPVTVSRPLRLRLCWQCLVHENVFMTVKRCGAKFQQLGGAMMSHASQWRNDPYALLFKNRHFYRQ